MCFHIRQTEDKQRASQQFSKLQVAMKVLGISGDEQRAFWLVLGAICHLGAAGATKGKMAAPATWLTILHHLLFTIGRIPSTKMHRVVFDSPIAENNSTRAAHDRNAEPGQTFSSLAGRKKIDF